MDVNLRVIREVPEEFDASSDTRCCCFKLFGGSSSTSQPKRTTKASVGTRNGSGSGDHLIGSSDQS